MIAANSNVRSVPSRRVLLAEDDPQIRETIGELLRDHNFEVTAVENGLLAMRALERALESHTLPDLIVLDLMMPVMDGWAFRLEQKRRPDLARIPVLVISADESPKASAIDAEYFIKKPFEVRELEHAVEEILLATERQREQARMAQTDRLASVGLLAAGVSHEINNPLAYVISNLDFLAGEVARLEMELPPGRLGEISQAIHEARDGASRVQKIVRGIGTFSRVQEAHRGPVDIHRVLEITFNMVWNEIRHRGVLEKELGPVPMVEADEAQLAQVFINILVNAAQALDEKRADTNRITVTTRTDELGWAIVEVRDTGIGIVPADLPRIFDPFFSTKPIGAGSGLGLYICYGIVSGLKGRIEVESDPGRGAMFRVRLPPGMPREAPRKTPTPVAVAVPAPRARILVIDDEPLICTTLRRALSQQHDVVTSSSAESALELLERGERFDLIFCDLMMPQMSGMDLYERLRARDSPLADRFVFLTGGAFTPRARAFLDRVPNAHIEKPFRLDDLRNLVRERLHRP